MTDWRPLFEANKEPWPTPCVDWFTNRGSYYAEIFPVKWREVRVPA